MVFRADRDCPYISKSGGDLIGLRKSFKVEALRHQVVKDYEQVTLKLKYRATHLLISCVYFPPLSNKDKYVSFLSL